MSLCAIEQCDVHDIEKLRVFRDRRAQWIAWLDDRDPHSIWKQIGTMHWDAVLFRTINDLRRAANERPTAAIGFNQPVIRLFDAGFVATQALAIRRLTDPPGRDPDKGVVSVRRLLQDIRDNLSCITREGYVCHDGIPYERAPADVPAHGGWVSEASAAPRLRHEAFYVFAKTTSPGTRSRSDVLPVDWLDQLSSRLSVCDDVRIYVDKFIAHAADRSSREDLDDRQTGITLDQLKKCHRAIYRVAAFIYGPLLQEGSYGAMPVSQYDQLENLDKSWVGPETKDFAHDCWQRHERAVEEWTSEDLWSLIGRA